MVPLCNYILPPATVKMSETFLETILWKPFQLFRRILNCVSSISKAPFPQSWLQSAGKNQLEPGQEGMGNDPVLLHRSLQINPWPKLVGVLEYCREGETSCCFSVCRARFLLAASFKATNDVSVHFFPYAAIHVNYTSEKLPRVRTHVASLWLTKPE